MRIRLQDDFLFALNIQVEYIAKDKPIAARRFKSDLIKKIKKDLKNPFYFQKSRYFKDENIRDYVFTGYTIVYYIDIDLEIVSAFGFIKHKDSL